MTVVRDAPERRSIQEVLEALHESRVGLEERIRLAQTRARFEESEAARAEAEREEAKALMELDAVMTRIRATEARLVVVEQGRQPRFK